MLTASSVKMLNKSQACNQCPLQWRGTPQLSIVAASLLSISATEPYPPAFLLQGRLTSPLTALTSATNAGGSTDMLSACISLGRSTLYK